MTAPMTHDLKELAFQAGARAVQNWGAELGLGLDFAECKDLARVAILSAAQSGHLVPVEKVRELPDGLEIAVRHIPQVPMKAFEVEAKNYEDAERISDILANYDLFQFENNVKPDYSNATFVVVRHPKITDGEWHSVDDQDEWEDILADARQALKGDS